MTTTLLSAATSLTQLQVRVTDCETAAPDFYAVTLAAHRELGDLRGAIALFMADDQDASVSANTKGFAQNVANAIEGLDRVLVDASKSALALMAARRQFAPQVQAWQDSVAKDAAAVAALAAPPDELTRVSSPQS